MCVYLEPPAAQQTLQNKPAFQSSGCGKNPEVRETLAVTPLPHKAGIFPLFFFSGVIFLEAVAKY